MDPLINSDEAKQITVSNLADRLSTTFAGLSSSEAEIRRNKFGPNEISFDFH